MMVSHRESSNSDRLDAAERVIGVDCGIARRPRGWFTGSHGPNAQIARYCANSPIETPSGTFVGRFENANYRPSRSGVGRLILGLLDGTSFIDLTRLRSLFRQD